MNASNLSQETTCELPGKTLVFGNRSVMPWKPYWFSVFWFSSGNFVRAKLHKTFILVWASLMVLLGLDGAVVAGWPWAKIVRESAGIAEHVPVSRAEQVAQRLAKSKAVEEAIEKDLKAVAELHPDLKAIERDAFKAAAMSRLLERYLANPEVRRSVNIMDVQSRQAAVILARGGRTMAEKIPDLALRGRLLKDGGSELVAAVGLHGPQVATEALRVESAIKSGALSGVSGVRPVTLADFGAAMTRFGGGSWSFWKTYVVPHWDKWLVGGAVAAYISNPEYFQDAAGKLTREGFKTLTELVGKVAAEGIRGIGEGSETATNRVGDAIVQTYFKGWRSAFAIAMTVGCVGLVALLIPRLRYYLLRPIKWLFKTPVSPQKSRD